MRRGEEGGRAEVARQPGALPSYHPLEDVRKADGQKWRANQVDAAYYYLALTLTFHPHPDPSPNPHPNPYPLCYQVAAYYLRAAELFSERGAAAAQAVITQARSLVITPWPPHRPSSRRRVP
eukprot:scaffold1122_cov50-Phaeocystis_antarctica.AAC.5